MGDQVSGEAQPGASPMGDGVRPADEFSFRGRPPAAMWAVLIVLAVAGAVLIVLAWAGVLADALVVPGLVLLIIGIGGAVFVHRQAAAVRQTVRLDEVGIHVGMPQPTGIGWDEVGAVKQTGQMLRLELRDGSVVAIDGSRLRGGAAALGEALVARLQRHHQP